MIKKITILSLYIVVFNSFSQQKQLPEGWDEIILEDKPAYMNLITGDVTTKFPTKPSLKKKEIVEYDPTIIHTVKKGETLSIIARKYNMSLSQIIRFNNLENFDTVEVGSEIVVGYQNEKSFSTQNTLNTQYYIVKSGDTLYKISKNHSISVAKLKRINNLSNNIIFIGQQLRID